MSQRLANHEITILNKNSTATTYFATGYKTDLFIKFSKCEKMNFIGQL